MKLNEIKDNEGARKSRMRVGRGIGCTKGKTCGRGGKGQTARTGVRINGFEGGQMPIHRRLPKRGFTNHHRTELAALNLGDLEKIIQSGKLDTSKPITLEILRETGVVKSKYDGVKLLGKGSFSAKVTLEVTKASASAMEAVKKAGGTVMLPAQAN